MKMHFSSKIILSLLILVAGVIISSDMAAAQSAINFQCDAVPGTGNKATTPGMPCGIKLPSGIEVMCDVNGIDGKVEMLCTTNEYNICSTNVCLIRIDDKCRYDWECEGGAICNKEGSGASGYGYCEVDIGDTSLGGTIGTTSDIRDTARRFINLALGFLGVLVVLMIIYGGFLWLTSAGQEDKVTKGKHIIVWAAIGAIVISIAWTISSYVLKLGKSVG